MLLGLIRVVLLVDSYTRKLADYWKTIKSRIALTGSTIIYCMHDAPFFFFFMHAHHDHSTKGEVTPLSWFSLAWRGDLRFVKITHFCCVTKATTLEYMYDLLVHSIVRFLLPSTQSGAYFYHHSTPTVVGLTANCMYLSSSYSTGWYVAS